MWSVLTETARILHESAGYLLLGFALAGLLHWLVNRRPGFSNLLNTRGTKSVFLAALFGLPLPLCSCSVLPAGLALRKKGASKGATVSFLISVPETDIVSILITYGLLGPVMAILRPLAALVTAIVTGLAANMVDQWIERSGDTETTSDTCCTEDCDVYDRRKSALWNIVHYGFVKFFDDIIGSLLFGIVLGGIITASLPALGLERLADQSLLCMLAMLVIGIPMYVCATSSTPIAVGLIVGGVSPGAALVFLLAGPATNVASLVVLSKYLGRAVLAVYLCSIAVVSVLMGLWFDAFMGSTAVTLPAVVPLSAASSFTPLKIGGAIVLVALSYLSFRRMRTLDRLMESAARRTGLPLSTGLLKVTALVCGAVVYLASGFFAVAPGERGMEMCFGRVVRSNLSPGLHYRWPYPIGRQDVESVVEVKRIELGFRLGVDTSGVAARAAAERMRQGESWMLTGNEDIVDITWVVQYHVLESGLRDYVYGLGDPEQLVRCAAETAIRTAVGRRNIDTLLTTERHTVEKTVKEDLLQPALDRCSAGVRVLDVNLLDVHAPPNVHRAFRDVHSAAEEKMETINIAQEYEERTVCRARGEAASRILEAAGRAVDMVQRAKGDGGAFVDQWEAYRVKPAVTRLRLYLEAVDAVLLDLRKYIQAPSGSGEGLDLWLIKAQAPVKLPFLPDVGVRAQP